jgi:uncharacterized protein YneR
MSKLKIKTHTTYTYETTDGREFDIAEEAQKWQEQLEILKGITMLDSKFQNTADHSEAFYVHIKTNDQQEAFEALQAYEGMCAHIPKPGYWYYDEYTDSYVDAVEERDRLQSIIETLDVLGK